MTHAEVLAAEIHAPEAALKCKCGQPGTTFWPAIHGCLLAKWHCDACLAKAKDELLVALGSQPFIPTS